MRGSAGAGELLQVVARSAPPSWSTRSIAFNAPRGFHPSLPGGFPGRPGCHRRGDRRGARSRTRVARRRRQRGMHAPGRKGCTYARRIGISPTIRLLYEHNAHYQTFRYGELTRRPGSKPDRRSHAEVPAEPLRRRLRGDRSFVEGRAADRWRGVLGPLASRIFHSDPSSGSPTGNFFRQHGGNGDPHGSEFRG